MIKLLLGYKAWNDILVFNYGATSYILQGCKHRITNATCFRIKGAANITGTSCGTLQKEHLIKAGLWKQ